MSTPTDLVKSAGVIDNDYCKLKYYLNCALARCGVDVLQPVMLDFKSDDDDAEQKDAIKTVATGKQFGLQSLSYKTVFLDDNNESKMIPDGESHTWVPVEEISKLPDPYREPLLLGGMIPVSTSHALICTRAWIRTFYAEPAAKLHGKAGGTISDDEIDALFVKTTNEDRDAEAEDMVSKLKQMMMGMKEDQVEKFESFSGKGQSLGSKASTDTQDVFDPSALPDSPPAINAAEATTSIAVRLPSGKRQVVKLNVTSSTVQDLAAHLKIAAEGNRFRLMAGFPPKPLVDASATIEAAGLKGAQVSMQKV